MDVISESQKMKIIRLVLGTWETNAYIIICRQTGKSLLIDVPAGARTIVKHLKETEPEYIFLTHNHIDHIGAYGLRTQGYQRIWQCIEQTIKNGYRCRRTSYYPTAIFST